MQGSMYSLFGVADVLTVGLAAGCQVRRRSLQGGKGSSYYTIPEIATWTATCRQIAICLHLRLLPTTVTTPHLLLLRTSDMCHPHHRTVTNGTTATSTTRTGMYHHSHHQIATSVALWTVTSLQSVMCRALLEALATLTCGGIWATIITTGCHHHRDFTTLFINALSPLLHYVTTEPMCAVVPLCTPKPMSMCEMAVLVVGTMCLHLC